MTLYLGLNRHTAKKYQAHFLPILRLTPYKSSPAIKKARDILPSATHIILTSPSSSSLFLSRMLKLFPRTLLHKKFYICLGETTKKRTLTFLPKATIFLAQEEISEGLFPIIEAISDDSSLLYPHSALSRPTIKKFLITKNKKFFAYPHYTMKPRSIKKALFSRYQHIILTSPSSVRAYAKIFPKQPQKTHWCQGPITLQEFQNFFHSEAKLLKQWGLINDTKYYTS